MRGTDFLDKMSLVEPAFVETADEMPIRKKYTGMKWSAVAACILLGVFVATKMFSQDAENPDNIAKVPAPTETEKTGTHMAPGATPETVESPQPQETTETGSPNPQTTPEMKDGLQMLALAEHPFGDMGFEGLMAYDVSELVSANPWNEEMDITHLPVYKNTLGYTDETKSGLREVDFDALNQQLTEVVARFEYDSPETLTIEYDYDMGGESGAEYYRLPVRLCTHIQNFEQAQSVELQVEQDRTVTISFEPAVELPDEWNIGDYASYEESMAAAEYLREEYDAWIGFSDPQINITGGDYNIYQQQSYDIEFFDDGDDDVEKILNYNFDRVVFYGNAEGKLHLVRIYAPDRTEKMGDYPIVTPDEAQELLENGHYITTVPYEIVAEEYIADVELVYRANSYYDEYFMPYYRFYVEIPELEENGMKTFGAFYVPAMKGEYIANMPVWDGEFN